MAVLDYGIGNLRSAQKALEHVGAQAVLTAEAERVAEAAAVVLPGVGAFGRCAEALCDAGLDGLAREAALDAADGGRPFLGICVGMQLLYEASEETPGVDGLGVLRGRVKRLPDGVKRPQMQWNRLDVRHGHPCLAGLPDGAWVYFVHGYSAPVAEETVATCEYGSCLSAAVARGSLFGVQFHPEKSGRTGLLMLSNFVGSLSAQAAPA